MKYYLVVNSFITDPDRNDDDNPLPNAGNTVGHSVEKLYPFEELSQKTLVLNELSISTDPFYLAYRGYQLLEYVSNIPVLGPEMHNYIEATYALPYPHLIYQLIRLYFANNKDGQSDMIVDGTTKKLDLTILFKPDAITQRLFDVLSQVHPSTHPIRLISIRKYPFFKVAHLFLLTDFVFLMDKVYGQFINDFWFDRVQMLKDAEGQPLFPIKRYRVVIGHFLEDYLKQIVYYCFEQSKHFHIYQFDQLNLTTTGGRPTQLLDLYIRCSSDLFLAEVKSTVIYDKEKYAEDLDRFYRHDRQEFFNAFGISQLISALGCLEKTAPLFDPGFPKKGKLIVYPAIVINDKALQTPAMAKVFNDHFISLLPGTIDPLLKIRPLSLIHLTDWENMADHLNENPTAFFKLLKTHVRIAIYIPPFYHTLAVNNTKRKWKKPLELLSDVLGKYGDDNLPVDE